MSALGRIPLTDAFTYVCVYIYMSALVKDSSHRCIYVHEYIYVYEGFCWGYLSPIRLHIWVYIYTYTYIYTNIHVHKYAHTYIDIYEYIYVHGYAYIYEYIHIWIYINYIHIHIYMNIYIHMYNLWWHLTEELADSEIATARILDIVFESPSEQHRAMWDPRLGPKTPAVVDDYVIIYPWSPPPVLSTEDSLAGQEYIQIKAAIYRTKSLICRVQHSAHGSVTIEMLVPLENSVLKRGLQLHKRALHFCSGGRPLFFGPEEGNIMSLSVLLSRTWTPCGKSKKAL